MIASASPWGIPRDPRMNSEQIDSNKWFERLGGSPFWTNFQLLLGTKRDFAGATVRAFAVNLALHTLILRP
jgi:hypothetical protein